MLKNNSRILILGYGEMGHALEYLLKPRHKISIWDPYVPEQLPEIELRQAAEQSEFIIFCTPTAPIFELAKTIRPAIPSDSICICMAKSLDDQGRTAPEALSQGLGGQPQLGFLYGPMIAENILAGKLAFCALAASDNQVERRVLKLFQSTKLKSKGSKDMIGSAWCAVLKNPYAILFGLIDELEMGANVRGFLTVAALDEMASIIELFGGRRQTAYSLAGLGDLICTGTSRDSHHHELGRMIARGEHDDLSGEGVNTLVMIQTHKLINTKQFPLLDCASEIVLTGKEISVFENLIEQLTAQ